MLFMVCSSHVPYYTIMHMHVYWYVYSLCLKRVLTSDAEVSGEAGTKKKKKVILRLNALSL